MGRVTRLGHRCGKDREMLSISDCHGKVEVQHFCFQPSSTCPHISSRAPCSTSCHLLRTCPPIYLKGTQSCSTVGVSTRAPCFYNLYFMLLGTLAWSIGTSWSHLHHTNCGRHLNRLATTQKSMHDGPTLRGLGKRNFFGTFERECPLLARYVHSICIASQDQGKLQTKKIQGLSGCAIWHAK